MEKQLQDIFQKPFQGFDNFKENVITPVFGEIQPYKKSFKSHLNDAENKIISDVICWGEMDLATDGDNILFFEVILQPKVNISRNKVTIQNYIRHELLPYSAALIVFHFPDNEGEWRLSFVSKGSNASDSTSAKRYTYLLGENQPIKTILKRFEWLILKDKTINNITEAFSVEALSNEFFEKYRIIYADFVQHVTGKRYVKDKGKWIERKIEEPNNQLFSSFSGVDKDVRDYVKKMMGRLVFLQFLQKKGWLGVPIDKSWGDGNQHYLQQLFAESKLKDNFLDEVLEVLFFDTLNTDRVNQRAADILGFNIKIPYLNGGLFEQDELDTKKVVFPSFLFEKLLQFFSEYNFTIDENDPNDAEVGVDPEMLGRIFENLLEDNKDKGAYYTPKEIVQHICQESLINYIQTHTKVSLHKSIENLIKKNQVDDCLKNKVNANLINQLLLKVRICDPAIGSGAFPMGMLNEIFHARRLLFVYLDIKEIFSASKIKKEIIQNNIYGVDLENGAVDIARLRFWLSLVVDEDVPHPLPNLDFKIMQGNSLLESFEGEDISNIDEISADMYVSEVSQLTLGDEFEAKKVQLSIFDKKTKEDLNKLLSDYFDTEKSQLDKNVLKKQINDIVDGKIHAFIQQKQIQKYNAYKKYEKKWKSAGIEDFDRFDKTSSEYKKYNEQKSEYERLMNIENKLVDVSTSNSRNFFLWHLWFKQVFDSNGGFDIIVGNPPYGAKLNAADKDYFQTKYHTAKSILGIQKGSLDTFTLFIELGHRLTCTGGSVHFIVPISITSSDSMTGVHRMIENDCSLIKVSSYSVRPQPVFENAVVNTSILFFKKDGIPAKNIFSTKMYRKNKEINLKHLVDNLEFIDIKDFKLQGRYPKISCEIEKQILSKIFSKSVKIGDLINKNGKPIYYRTTGGRYFKIITNYSTGSTKEKPIYFKKELADCLGAILSSNLYFWFYQIYSNNLDLKSYEIETFRIPIEQLNCFNTEKLNKLYSEYLVDVEKNANVRQTTNYANIDSFKEYKIGKSKHLIDQIDDIIAPLYGLTDEELLFIKNYEIQFRLSEEE